MPTDSGPIAVGRCVVQVACTNDLTRIPQGDCPSKVRPSRPRAHARLFREGPDESGHAVAAALWCEDIRLRFTLRKVLDDLRRVVCVEVTKNKPRRVNDWSRGV